MNKNNVKDFMAGYQHECNQQKDDAMEMGEYHTLAIFDEEMGQWFDEFGSYVKDEVKEEESIARDQYTWTCILTTDGTQVALVSAINRLNHQF